MVALKQGTGKDSMGCRVITGDFFCRKKPSSSQHCKSVARKAVLGRAGSGMEMVKQTKLIQVRGT